VQSDAKESQDDTTAEEQHTVTPLETTEPTK
jgi:hypothetical protein